MPKGLEGRVALVTGASSGIGAAAARGLALRGCSLILAARRIQLLEALAEEIEAGPCAAAALPVHLDVTDRGSIDRCVQTAAARFGHVDILVNNAGVGMLDWLERLDPMAGIQQQLDVNLLGAIQMTRAVLPGMMERRQGHIIQMASMASWIAAPTYGVYAASKFGLRGFSEALRREVTPWGIHVSVLYPGAVRTGFASAGVAKRRTRLTTPRFLVLISESVGEAVSRLAVRPRRSLVMPAVMRPLIWVNSLFPGLVDVLVVRGFVRRERRGTTHKPV